MSWFRGRFIAYCHDGCAYTHSEDYWYEDYADELKIAMTRHRQGAVLVDDNKPFVFNELAIECNVGTWGRDGYDEEKIPRMLLQVSKDGGEHFGNTRSTSMGKTGQFSYRVRFHNLGINRLCVIRLTYSHPTSLELTTVSQRITPTARVI